jgi:NADH-quinone oxidoreductase subunit L
MTAFYMFRLYHLTFSGSFRGSSEQAHHLHESPASMVVPLQVLAVGSILAGFLGVPAALGGNNWIEHYLHPVFQPAHHTLEQAHAAAVPGHGVELGLMALSVAIAAAGIGLAWRFYKSQPELAERVAARFAGAHRVLLNKYYVDEIYDAAVVQPIRMASQEGLWRGFDVKVIDGAVNGAGAIVDGSATLLRRVQTGSVRTYAGSLFVGVVMILGYYLWR